MEVDDVIVLDADDAVAVGLGEGAHLCGACALVLIDEELGAVAVLDVLDLHQVVPVKTPLPAFAVESWALLGTASPPATMASPWKTLPIPSKMIMMP